MRRRKAAEEDNYVFNIYNIINLYFNIIIFLTI